MLVRIAIAVSLTFAILASSVALAQTQSSTTPEDLAKAKAELEQRKQDILLQEAELRAMELKMAQQAAPKPAAKPVAVAKTSAPTSVATPIPQRANIDPSPYEAAITGHVSAFRTSQSSKWLALDEKRLVYWVLDDEAYLLNLSQPCKGLLSTKKLRLENFSTKVRAGKDGVVLSDQQWCLIESIAKLGGRSLPKPPKK